MLRNTSTLRTLAAPAARLAPANTRSYISKAQLIGRLGNAPEKAQTSSGKDYYRYNLAVQKPPKRDAEGNVILDDQGYPVRDSSWFTIFNFNERSAESVEKLKAGSLIFVEANIDSLTTAPVGDNPATKQIIFKETSHRVLSKPRDQE